MYITNIFLYNFRSPQTKIVREDATHNMYAHGVTEVEVKVNISKY